MARARNIKPGFFVNDELVELPFEVRLLFIGLWTIADRDGRLVDRPKKIKMEIFPGDDVDVDKALSSLALSGFIARYVADGRPCIQIINWDKHQNPHVKEAVSTIPKMDEQQTSTRLAPVNAQPSPEQAGLIPDSLNLIPDSGLPSKTEPPQAAPAAPKYSAIADLVANGVDEQVAADWLKVRKGKKLAPNKTGIDGVLREISNAGMTPDQGVRLCCERGWGGFNPAWLANAPARASPGYQSPAEKSKSITDALTGKKSNERRLIDIN
jgi:hypothetical protein